MNTPNIMRAYFISIKESNHLHIIIYTPKILKIIDLVVAIAFHFVASTKTWFQLGCRRPSKM